MKKTIVGEQRFQSDSHSLSVSPSNENYYLYVSANGTQYSKADENPIEAGDTLIVSNAPRNMWYCLSGNNSTVTVIA